MIKPSQVCGIIPARWGATRFPGKLLHPIAGVPLLARVVRGCMRAQRVGRWVVATDDARLAAVARYAGAEVVMTPSRLKSGSDRVAFVAKGLRARWIINWQGDEWLPDGRPIDLLIEALEQAPDCRVATLARPLSHRDAKNPNRVKVVVSRTGRALYFSRAAIPHSTSGTGPVQLHVGTYAYERRALMQFAAWQKTPLEKRESLEQLRLLENDVPIVVARCRVATFGVDVPADAAVLTKRLATKPRTKKGE